MGEIGEPVFTAEEWPEEPISARLDRCREMLHRYGVTTHGQNSAIAKRIAVTERMGWEDRLRLPVVQLVIDGEVVAEAEVSARHWTTAGPILRAVPVTPDAAPAGEVG